MVPVQGELMGEAAAAVQARLRDRLAAGLPGLTWTTEFRVGRTPVDVAGEGEHGGEELLILVELEWRRADPSDNPVKLFRHVAEDRVDADRVLLVQAFSGYYDLADGGVSAKRRNAEFAGEFLAEAVERVAYAGVTLPVATARGDADPPAGWEDAVDSVVEHVRSAVGDLDGPELEDG